MMFRVAILSLALVAGAHAQVVSTEVNFANLREQMVASEVFQKKVQVVCQNAANKESCADAATNALLCKLLQRSQPEMAAAHCGQRAPAALNQVGSHAVPEVSTSQKSEGLIQLKSKFTALHKADGAPEDDLAKEMTHDLEMNFNKIAPFGKEDTAKELQDHAAKTQDTLVDAVENAEVAEIKRAVFRALTRLRAATIKEFDTIARLETQAIDAYNDAHHYRAENPLAHLHEDEAPVETDKLKSFH